MSNIGAKLNAMEHSPLLTYMIYKEGRKMNRTFHKQRIIQISLIFQLPYLAIVSSKVMSDPTPKE